MTLVNQKLRAKVKEIELLATTALQSQPEDDDGCKIHLLKAISDIMLKASDGVVEFWSNWSEVMGDGIKDKEDDE